MKDFIKKRGWYIVLFTLLLLAVSMSAMGSDEVVEKDGVLYFPDGNPVRNYEQLHIYETSE